MSYIDTNLVPGEKVIYQTRLHWVVMLWHLVLGIFLLILPGVVLLVYAVRHPEFEPRELHLIQGAAGVLLLLGIIVLAVGLVRRSATEMAVTTRRVVVKTGLAARKSIEMLLNKVESIEVSETGMGRVMGYGTIVVIGTGGTSEPFHKVAHPLEFRNQVQLQIERRGEQRASPAEP